MTNLDTGNGVKFLDGSTDTRQTFDLRIFPQAKVAMGDPAFSRNAGRRNHRQAKAAQGKLAVVDELIVIHVSAQSLVLAHGGDSEPVAQGKAAQAQVFK
jgi:hypothetical protein